MKNDYQQLLTVLSEPIDFPPQEKDSNTMAAESRAREKSASNLAALPLPLNSESIDNHSVLSDTSCVLIFLGFF